MYKNKKKTVELKKTKGKKGKKKGSKLTSFVLALILATGVGIMAYPTVSEWWNEKHATRAIASYVEQVEQIEDDTRKEMLEKARQYNASLQSGTHFNLSEEEYAEYESILDISGTGIMGYIQIPSIHVNLPIYHGTGEEVLQIAAGHIAGSSFPIGGQGTHAVISGHRGLPSAKLFTDLDKLVEGDVFMVSVLEQVITYQIDQIHIVLPEEVADLAIETDKDYMTLVTCTPYGVNTHRMLIRGHRIDNLKGVGNYTITSDARRISKIKVCLCLAGAMTVMAMIISMLSGLVKHKKKSTEQLLKELEYAAGGKNDEKDREDNR